MTVTKEFTRLEKSSVKLSVTIGKDDVRAEYDGILTEYSKTIQIPGFRKGKVPKNVLLRKFGEALNGEVLGKIIEKAAEEIFQDEALPRGSRPLPYAAPQLQGEPKLDLESELSFSMVYDVLPDVKVASWQGLEVEVDNVSVTDEDIARELTAIQERNSITLDKDDGQSAEKDNIVTVNYSELDDEGKTVPGSERQDFTFTLGTERNYFKFDDEIAGMKKGETKTFTKTYPADCADTELAGTTKKLSATLTALKVKKLPDVDDDLAQDVDEKFKTLDDLKTSIRTRMEKDLDLRRKSMKVNALLEKIMENTPVEIPESMLNMELDSRWRNLAQSLNTDAQGLYKMLGNSPAGAEPLIEGWKGEAGKSLHSRLIVETLVDELKLEASDNEIEAELTKIAANSGVEIAEVKKYYETERAQEYLKEEIKEHKFFDMLLEKNTVKPGKKATYSDLVLNNR
ncbi:MAG: trigger factor [Treponema sp.]|nr:trigger factor [Treponema sp.]